MYYETAQTIGPGWHKYFKPTHNKEMDWPPSSKHFRSPGSSPESYRRIIHPEDGNHNIEDGEFFNRRSSPTFSRKIFRDVWDDSAPNHRFIDRPRLFKRVFRPNRWDDEDDFERTSNTVRQLARDFDSDFDSHKLDRDFEPDFRHREHNPKPDVENGFERFGKVHHIPIMVERRLDEMRSKFGKHPSEGNKPEYQEEPDEWQGPQVQRLRKNFEMDEDFAPINERHRAARVDINKPRAFTCPMPTRWDSESVHTLPIRRSNRNTKMFYDDPPTVPNKSVYRSYSETHEDIPKQHQQHAAAFRSHSDGHCPKTYVTKISVNVPSTQENQNQIPNGEATQEMNSQNSDNLSTDGLESHQKRTRCKSQQSHNTESKMEDSDSSDFNNRSFETAKTDEKPTKENKRTSLQQIAAVMQNVDDLFVHVDGYSGTGRDKQFRFLDEMLTRCMLRLDDVDTEGREDIRIARRAAVKQVQTCIEKLEAKATECERAHERLMREEAESSQAVKNQQEPENEKENSCIANVQNQSEAKPSDNEEIKPAEIEEPQQNTEEETSKDDNEQTRL